MILGLRTVIYPVSDLAAARCWYGTVLEQAPYSDGPSYVGFSIGSFETGLLPDGRPPISGSQVLWGVADADTAHARLIGLGAGELEPVNIVGEGIRVGAVTDPFGNRLGIILNLHFKPSDVR